MVRMRPTALTLFAGICVIFAVAVVDGQTIFLSPVDTVGGGVRLADPNLSFSSATVTSGQVNVWATLEPNQTLVAQSLNLVAETPGVIEMTSVEVKNPLLQLSGNVDAVRWEYINEPPATADAIDGFSGFQVVNDSELPAEGIGPNTESVDPLYDPAANAWLLATINYDVVGFGSTELFLQVGANGISGVDQPSEEIEVVFGGSGDPPLNADFDRGVNSLTADAVVYNVELLGDVNGDGAVNGLDVDPFVDTLLSGLYAPDADMNLDGFVNGLDVDLFVDAVVGGGVSANALVPEPSTMGLLVAAVLALGGLGLPAAGRYRK